MADSTRKYDGFVPGAHEIEGLGAGGFRFAGMSHRGSLLVLPSGIRAWPVSSPVEVTFASLAAVLDEEPGSIELLLIGMGTEIRPIHPDLRNRLKAAGIGVDPMATTHAVSTFNILSSERRRVAAALLAVA